MIHEGEMVTMKDRLTKHIVELERKLESLQQKYNDTTNQLTTRLGDLETTTRLQEEMLRKESEQKAEIIVNLHDAKNKVSNDAHELEYLRQTRIELSQEREGLINDLLGH